MRCRMKLHHVWYVCTCFKLHAYHVFMYTGVSTCIHSLCAYGCILHKPSKPLMDNFQTGKQRLRCGRVVVPSASDKRIATNPQNLLLNTAAKILSLHKLIKTQNFFATIFIGKLNPNADRNLSTSCTCAQLSTWLGWCPRCWQFASSISPSVKLTKVLSFRRLHCKVGLSTWARNECLKGGLMIERFKNHLRMKTWQAHWESPSSKPPTPENKLIAVIFDRESAASQTSTCGAEWVEFQTVQHPSTPEISAAI